ncbi:hypothetical protein ACTFIV_005793 [Dictyostelium citrinum]
MKLIFCLLFLTLSLIRFTRSTQISNEYVNFVAFSDSECSIPSKNGYGYSMAINTCTTLDNVNNFVFNVDGGQISWRSYENTFYIGEVCSNPNSQTQSYPVNSCIPSSSIYINSGTGVTKPTFYYKVTTSSTPYIPSNSYINSYMGEQCSENYIVALQYYANNTRVFATSSPQSFVYYCNPITNYPVTIVCTNGLKGCISPPPNPSAPQCIGIQPFYNATGDTSYSSSCPTCCTSGTCSGTSGAATTGSYTGEGWSKPGDNQDDEKQQKIKLDKNDKLFTVTNSNSNQNNYYQNIFCS